MRRLNFPITLISNKGYLNNKQEMRKYWKSKKDVIKTTGKILAHMLAAVGRRPLDESC